jgi:hypothetical protein
MQTDNLAQEAVLEGYTRQLAIQPGIHHGSEQSNNLLLTQPDRLQSELVGMKTMLVSASLMLASSFRCVLERIVIPAQYP